MNAARRWLSCPQRRRRRRRRRQAAVAAEVDLAVAAAQLADRSPRTRHFYMCLQTTESLHVFVWTSLASPACVAFSF